VGLFGGSFFGIAPAVLQSMLAAFDDYRGRIAAFRVSTKPVPLGGEIIDLAKRAGVQTVELGVPCFDDGRLTFLNRGHSVADLETAFHRLRSGVFQVALQVMTGLPGETMDDVRHTAGRLLDLRPDYVRIYPLALLKGTPLDRFVAEGAVNLPAFDEVLERTAFLYLALERAGVRVATMGLTDGEVLREKIAGGAYHPAFGFLVKAEAFLGAVLATARRAGLAGGSLVVRLNRRDIPHLVGYRRRNLQRLSDSGLSVSWQEGGEAVGTFALIRGAREYTGTIFDALPAG
jgi:hypothetical protein